MLEQLGRNASVVPETARQTLAASGLAYDSRRVKVGQAFFCLPGQKTDGNQFIEDAARAGAACIFSEQPAPHDLPVPYIRVSDARDALALVADYYYGHPSQQLRLLGVTGTNGKTTTTHLIEQIMRAAGHKVGLIGTLGARWETSSGERTYHDIKHTTPQSSDLQTLFSTMVSSGCTHVAMEVSSHALALKRVAHSSFSVACLTNITQDHLDFHKTMEHYWRSKRMLFEQLNDSPHRAKTAVINLDDPLAAEFIAAVKGDVRILTYGWQPAADCHVTSASFDFRGTSVSLNTPDGAVDLRLKLNGRFNVYNTLAAISVCLAEGIDLETCRQALADFPGVSGRFEVVSTAEGEGSEEPLCIVDYAHTPDGLENVLKAARALVPKRGKLIAVFGCGGDRDSSKRPQMGEIATNLADEVFVTSDNPRTEDPQQILADILAGIRRMKGVRVEPDRASAIRMAVEQASVHDVVVVAGKGHETYQILGDQTIDFDDRIEVKHALFARQQAQV